MGDKWCIWLCQHSFELRYYISAKPLHNRDTVSVHFNNIYCTEICDKLSRDLAMLTYTYLNVDDCRLVSSMPSKGLTSKLYLTLWGLGTWNFTSPRDWALLGFIFYFLLNQSFICHGSQFSSLFTILQEHMSLWPQCNIFFAPPSSWCSKWHHNDATMMLHKRDIYVLPVQ